VISLVMAEVVSASPPPMAMMLLYRCHVLLGSGIGFLLFNCLAAVVQGATMGRRMIICLLHIGNHLPGRVNEVIRSGAVRLGKSGRGGEDREEEKELEGGHGLPLRLPSR